MKIERGVTQIINRIKQKINIEYPISPSAIIRKRGIRISFMTKLNTKNFEYFL